MQELIAKNILLSHGGSVYPMPHEISYDVMTNDGVKTKSVVGINFMPGKSGGYFVCFMSGQGRLEDPEDKKRAFKFIINKYRYPDPYLDENELKNRLEIREANISFIAEHGDLMESDFEKISAIRARAAKEREFEDGRILPVPGDIVEGAYYGDAHPFKNGVIESPMRHSMPGRLTVCAEPLGPWVCQNSDGSLYVHTSGGPFFGFGVEDLEYVGEDSRLMEDWSHTGPCGNGAIAFRVKVNRWKIREGVDY